MPDKYFEQFPKIKYGNTEIVDITKRIAILESVSKNPYIFYPYEITNDERPDQFATRYYQDPYKSWIVYLTNKIVDPYYGWYLSQREFDSFIADKVGSLEIAYDKIINYRNDWSNSEDISVSRYDSLIPKMKSYWDPVYGINGRIISYTRKQKNWTVNTNKIVSYVVSNTSFTNNEICNIYFNANNTGTGQIVSTNTNIIYVQHTAGVTLSNTTVVIDGGSYIYGRESYTNTVFTNSSLIVQNIADEEEVYWKPITHYEYETDKNEFNKTIRVIDNILTNQIVKDFKGLMD